MILDCHKKATAPKELVSIELLLFTEKIAAFLQIQSTKEIFQILSTVRNYDAFLASHQYHTLANTKLHGPLIPAVTKSELIILLQKEVFTVFVSYK
jgi:hypothetical protein